MKFLLIALAKPLFASAFLGFGYKTHEVQLRVVEAQLQAAEAQAEAQQELRALEEAAPPEAREGEQDRPPAEITPKKEDRNR